MPVETATFLSQLNPLYPLGSDDSGDGDNHLRLIKSILKAQFPEFTAAALNATQAEIEAAIASVTGLAKLLLLAGSAAAPGLAVAGDEDTGLYSPGANQLAIACNGVAVLALAEAVASITGNLGVTGTLAVTGEVTGGKFTGPGAMPIGGSMPWWSDTLPTGFGTWAWMNGQSVNATTYAALAAVYPSLVSGGNVVLPDMREVTPVGKYNMGGSGTSPGRVTNFTLNTLNTYIGSSTHALAVTELPSHNHGVNDPGHSHTATTNAQYGVTYIGGGGGGGVTTMSTGSVTVYANITGISIGYTGSNAAHNNMQPSITCNWIMRIA